MAVESSVNFAVQFELYDVRDNLDLSIFMLLILASQKSLLLPSALHSPAVVGGLVWSVCIGLFVC